MGSIQRLCAAGGAAALIFLLTSFSKVPIPLGYAHLGDAAVFLAALYLPRREAVLAAAVGSALADILGGFPIWAGPTLLIKGGMAYIVARQAAGKRSVRAPSVWIGMTLSALLLAAGYTAAGAALYGSLALGLASLPGLLLEGIVNLFAALLAGAMLERAGFRGFR